MIYDDQSERLYLLDTTDTFDRRSVSYPPSLRGEEFEINLMLYIEFHVLNKNFSHSHKLSEYFRMIANQFKKGYFSVYPPEGSYFRQEQFDSTAEEIINIHSKNLPDPWEEQTEEL